MTITDPSTLVSEIDLEVWNEYRNPRIKPTTQCPPNELNPISFVEPAFSQRPAETSTKASNPVEVADPKKQGHDPIKSKVVRLGDFIDTDAVSL